MRPDINRDSYEYTFWNQTPEIYQQYREPYRTTSVPFSSGEKALADLQKPIPIRSFRADSEYVLNLNGRAEEHIWQFHWAYSCADKAIQTTPKADPRAFTGTQYGTNVTWDYITVPMSWQVAEIFDEATGLYRRLYDAPMYIGDGVIFENYDKPRDAASLRVDPDTASIGTYRRSFHVPAEWDGRENYICFNGVGTAFYVWVNGVYCGYGENRVAVSAFNITDAIRPGGKNEVVVEVYRNATGIYMEDQDMLRLSGIFRDVYLYSVNKSLSIRDFRTVPAFDGDYRDGTLTVKTYLHSYDGSDLEKAVVTASLYDGDILVAETRFSALDAQVISREQLMERGEDTDFLRPYESELVLKTSLEVSAPKHWTDETPNLYNLVLTVSLNGTVTEATGCKVGFRVLELKTSDCGKQYYTVNGQRVFLYGINRHEMWLTSGCWVSPEHHARELAQIKALNINSIRTAHYTCDPTLYDYCDQYGIYLFAEANVETASDIDDPSAPINKGPSEEDFENGGSGPVDIVGEEPTQEEKEAAIARRLGFAEASEMQLRLEPALLDRQKANVIPNKNHPSVIIWSLCNEAGSGTPYIRMHQWLTCYEEENRIIFYKAEYEGNTISDLDYPSPAAITNYLEGKDPRPLILSEYGWCEVQGRGGLSDSYVFTNDFARDYLNFLGMYVWSWKDMSLWAYGADTGVEDKLKAAGLRRYLGYQGMFMDKLYGAQQGHFALGAFSCNGVVTGSNEYKPDAVDLKAAYSRIRVEPVDLRAGLLRIESRYAFINLEQFDLRWSLSDGENDIVSGLEHVFLPPRQLFEGASVRYAAALITLPKLAESLEASSRYPGTELFVNLQLAWPEGTDWVLAAEQMTHGMVDGDTPYGGVVHIDPRLAAELQIPAGSIPAQMESMQGTVVLENAQPVWCITAGDTLWRFDSQRGVIAGCSRCGRALLETPLMPDFYAVINEQLGPSMGECTRTDWQKAVEDMQLCSVQCRQPEPGLLLIAVEAVLATSPESNLCLRYSFYGDGQVSVTTTVQFAEGLGTVPMIGYTAQVPAGFEQIKYFGAGPDESYPDRCHGTMVAAYETTPDKMAYPYLYPCENGNRTDCRWLTVTNGEGTGLLFSAEGTPLQCSVLHHTARQLRSQKKWTRSYYELLLPECRTEEPVVRVCYDVTGMGMGLATDYISHAIASGETYRYTFSIRPICTETIYPTLAEVSSQLRKHRIPNSLISGLLVDGKPAEDFRPGQKCYALETVRADYEELGEAALPVVEVTVPEGVLLSVETLPTEAGEVKKRCITAAYMGAEESLVLQWILTEEKPVSSLPYTTSHPDLTAMDRTCYGGSLKSVHSSGRGPTFRQLERTHARGVCLMAGQSAEQTEVTLDVSAYTERGYGTLRGLVGVAPGQKRLNTHGFNIDFEVAALQYEIEADGVLCAAGRCVPGGDSREIACDLGRAEVLTLRVRLPEPGYFRDTAMNFCDLKLLKQP